jgi:hypothetical protein
VLFELSFELHLCPNDSFKHLNTVWKWNCHISLGLLLTLSFNSILSVFICQSEYNVHNALHLWEFHSDILYISL